MDYQSKIDESLKVSDAIGVFTFFIKHPAQTFVLLAQYAPTIGVLLEGLSSLAQRESMRKYSLVTTQDLGAQKLVAVTCFTCLAFMMGALFFPAITPILPVFYFIAFSVISLGLYHHYYLLKKQPDYQCLQQLSGSLGSLSDDQAKITIKMCQDPKIDSKRVLEQIKKYRKLTSHDHEMCRSREKLRLSLEPAVFARYYDFGEFKKKQDQLNDLAVGFAYNTLMGLILVFSMLAITKVFVTFYALASLSIVVCYFGYKAFSKVNRWHASRSQHHAGILTSKMVKNNDKRLTTAAAPVFKVEKENKKSKSHGSDISHKNKSKV